MTKLGKRLTAIATMPKQQYDHVWDCCCDHGLLGFKLLADKLGQTIHFVDIVPALMVEIEQKLQRFYQGPQAWQVHCMDVGQLPIIKSDNERHLVIIAGVGGDLLISLLEKLLLRCQTLDVEFIVSPVHHNYALRQFLIAQNFSLIDEQLVHENNRFYEIYHVRQGSGKLISALGDTMWQQAEPLHILYLQQTIGHYQRLAKNPKNDVGAIIQAYQMLLSKIQRTN